MTSERTPWQRCEQWWLKREDLFRVAGVSGGKARTCWQLAQADTSAQGLVTAGSRASPQVNIVAHVGLALGLPVRAYVPAGEPSAEVAEAAGAGAELVPVRPGYNAVIRARAREWAEAEGWCHIPFGMECAEAVQVTAAQVPGIPEQVERLVVPVGSGMSLAGILWGLLQHELRLPVLGVCVGADPQRRLDTWAPPMWRALCDLVPAGSDYHRPAEQCELGRVRLDAHYEAKCIPHLRAGSGLWVVGIRQTAEKPEEVLV